VWKQNNLKLSSSVQCINMANGRYSKLSISISIPLEKMRNGSVDTFLDTF